jgi:hypothetical protein
MRYLRILAVFGMVLFAASFAHAQRVVVGVGIGAPGPVVVGAPVCAYGYYSYAPYACAPYGYYGPEWFNGGIFIGAGPWFHGYGHPGWGGRGFYGGRGFERGPVGGFRGGAGFHGGGNFHGGAAVHGGGGFHGGAVAHGGGGFHGGGSHGGGRR